MSTFVIDSNIFGKPKKEISILFRDNQSQVILTDNLIYESLNANKDDSLVADLRNFQENMNSIRFLDGIGPNMLKEIETGNLRSNLIDIETSWPNEDIQNRLSELNDSSKNKDFLKEGYEIERTNAQKYKSEMAKEFCAYKKELISTFGNKENMLIKDDDYYKIKDFLFNAIRKFLVSDFSKTEDEANEVAKNHIENASFFARALLADIALFLFYREKGTFPSEEKLNNSIIDVSFYPYASYADFFVTEDKNSRDIYNDFYINLFNNIFPQTTESAAIKLSDVIV